MKKVTVLIPTYNRKDALIATLSSLYSQEFTDFNVIISDQTPICPTYVDPTIQAITRMFKEKGIGFEGYWHTPHRGMAEQRNFLLNQSESQYSLFLDDDIFLEPYVLKNMVSAIDKEGFGFVGMAVQGLSYVNDIRENEEDIEFWEGKVIPEKIIPKSKEWERAVSNNAANIYHIQKKLNITPDNPRLYKVSWVGACVLFDTQKLREVGGFSFWKNVPQEHCGEDVMAELKVMEKYGGCGIIPSGAYHLEVATTIENRKFNIPEELIK